MNNRSFWDQFWNAAMLVVVLLNGMRSSSYASDEVWPGAFYYLCLACVFLTIFFIVNWPRKKTK